MATEIVIATLTQDPATGNVNMVAVLNGIRQDIAIPFPAIANRRLRFGLETDAAAIDAIIKEQVTRIMGLAPAMNGEVQVADGLRQDVTIRAGTAADIPPAPVPAKTVKEVLAADLQAAGTLAEVKAAMAKWAASR